MATAVEEASGKVICIDHHLPGKDGFDVTYASEAACATGELVFDLMEEMGAEVTAEMAEPLYVCLLSDTGSFRFSKTGPRAHSIAARLLELGVRPQEVYEKLYEGLSLSTILLTGDVLSTLRTDCGGRLAWLLLTQEMLGRREANIDDVSDVINHTLSLEGVEVGVLFKELGPGLTKASLRSKGRLNVNAFARRLGGGGHQHAAGIVLEEEFVEGSEILLEALREALKDLP
jgi:phosphoesterase RecJ-like protein